MINYDLINSLKENFSLIQEDYNFWRNEWPVEFPNWHEQIYVGDWKTFGFIHQGSKLSILNDPFGKGHPVEMPDQDTIVEKCKFYPLIKDSIDNGEIYMLGYSVLGPNCHIRSHRGYCDMVLRTHIPIIVPEGDLGLRLFHSNQDEEIIRWEKGVPVTFDDTIEHEAWNQSNEERVVLLIDLVK